MFKKLYSKSGNGATVTGEIKNEFARYFNKAENALRAYSERFPLPVFLAMVFCLAISCLLTVHLMISPGKKADKKPAQQPPVRSGFNQLVRTSSALKDLIGLNGKVDSICRKKSLTAADSALLEADLRQLKQIQKPLKLSK
jgi:hypothetical protein